MDETRENNFLPRNKELKLPSRKLRTESTPQENRLWYDFLKNFKPRFTIFLIFIAIKPLLQ
jgi:hypothetical protein